MRIIKIILFIILFVILSLPVVIAQEWNTLYLVCDAVPKTSVTSSLLQFDNGVWFDSPVQTVDGNASMVQIHYNLDAIPAGNHCVKAKQTYVSGNNTITSDPSEEFCFPKALADIPTEVNRSAN